MVERGGSHIASSSLLPLLNAFCPHRHEGKHEPNTAQTTWFKAMCSQGWAGTIYICKVIFTLVTFLGGEEYFLQQTF